MTLLQRIDANKNKYIYLTAALYLFLNNTINASIVWSEHNREGSPDISFWEPLVWEYSSALSTFIILPMLFAFFRRNPITLGKLKKQIALHFIASVVFSMLHVAMMITFREGAYAIVGWDYNFGPLIREFWYEYRKDGWGYLTWLVIYNVVAMSYSRFKGEASPIANNEDEVSDSTTIPEHFLVKKLDKEFLVKVSEIEWLESAGNYVNLHSNGRIYPLRTTLSQLTKRLTSVGFSRIHRSFGINHHAIDNIAYLPSGDGEITLKSGKKLALSRRYKDEFKQKLS